MRVKERLKNLVGVGLGLAQFWFRKTGSALFVRALCFGSSSSSDRSDAASFCAGRCSDGARVLRSCSNLRSGSNCVSNSNNSVSLRGGLLGLLSEGYMDRENCSFPLLRAHLRRRPTSRWTSGSRRSA